MAQPSVLESDKRGNLSDEDLLTLYYTASDEAFSEFDQRYRLRLTKWAFGRLPSAKAARRELAEDLASSTLQRVAETKIQRPHARWNASRGAVEPWIRRILRNQVVSLLRLRRVQESLDTDSQRDQNAESRLSTLTIHATSKVAVDSAAESQEQRHRLRQAIEQLPAEYQRAIQLRFWDGLTVAQIGAELGISQTKAFRWLTAAQDRLRASLSRHVLSA